MSVGKVIYLKNLGHRVGCGEVAVSNHRVEEYEWFRQMVTKREREILHFIVV